jgi:hypothetical protein
VDRAEVRAVARIPLAAISLFRFPTALSHGRTSYRMCLCMVLRIRALGGSLRHCAARHVAPDPVHSLQAPTPETRQPACPTSSRSRSPRPPVSSRRTSTQPSSARVVFGTSSTS